MVKRVNIRRVQVVLIIIVAIVCFAFIGKHEYRTSIFLPGTQPGQADTAVAISECKSCHPDQVRQWSRSMMAHAPKDPLFNAMLSITTKYMMERGYDVGEFCLRCHTPSGWLAGRSHPQTVQDLYGSDLDGVHCNVCHRMTNPLAYDEGVIVNDVVPGIGNGMYAVQKYQQPVRGTRGRPHPFGATRVDPFFKSSEFCGVCHEVSNPYVSPDARHTPPHLQKSMERTYSEWKLSWYASLGEAGTCQSCHMKKAVGKVSSYPGSPIRLDAASHIFTGGNTFAPRSVLHRWEGLDTNAIQEGIEDAKLLLKEAVKLELVAGRRGDSVIAQVRLTNLTGHKLPTGFPEGRRVWIQVTGRDRYGLVVSESGTYDTSLYDIIRDTQLKVYHTEPGISPSLAASFDVSAGPSFIVPLNDTVYFDNRIPPRGFQLASFTEHRAEPVGYHFREGQYWDENEYRFPPSVTSVEAIVWYQVASKEFIEFARRENSNNPYDWNEWGEKVYEDWLLYGQPVQMAATQTFVTDNSPALPPQRDVEMPVEIRLSQNYPNPCNPGTTIEYWLSQPSFVSLKVYDISGREVGNLVENNLASGRHIAYLTVSELSTGIYFYKLQSPNSVIIKKMLVIK